MTKIEIEKRPKRSLLPLLLALLVIALVAVGVYFYLENQRRTAADAPAGAVPAPADTLPPSGMQMPVPASAAPVVQFARVDPPTGVV